VSSINNARAAMGEKIRVFRKTRGLSTLEVGQLAAIPAGRIWALEWGYLPTCSHELKKIAAALDVKVLELFDWGEAIDDDDAESWECMRRC